MEMAARYLEDTASANKKTAKALRKAATDLTKETLNESSATDILSKANSEWDATTKRTILHEHKILEERKEKTNLIFRHNRPSEQDQPKTNSLD